MSEANAEPWRLSLFGPMELFAPSGARFRIESRKSLELLAFLALRRSPTVDRDTVADALWPDCDPVAGRNRLKQTLAMLRKEVEGLPIVAHGKHLLELSTEEVEVDFRIIEQRIKWLRALGGRHRQDAVRQILETTREGLLPGLSVSWAESDRRRYCRVTEELERELELSGTGSFSTFQLGDELGGLRVPIVGREAELSQVRSWLRENETRRLFLVGTPGVGKTRILVETLATCKDFSDAVISLSTVQVSESPWQERLGEAVGIRDGEKLTAGLIKLLSDFKRPLLAIDDADQAEGEMSEWVDQILAAVPRLRMIATARRRPSDALAKVIDVGPLPGNRDGETVASTLLMRFAHEAGVSSQDLDANRGTIEAVAEHLEGLPLALEVAAGWLPFMTPKSLLRKLQDGSSMVIQRAAKGRGTLVECMEAICLSLSGAEREALLCLSICKGGCGEALAEATLGPEWPWQIRSLSERSLAAQVSGSAGVRFLVLQAIRESVRTLSTQEDVSRCSERYREACLRLGETAVWEIQEGDRRSWLDWLRDEGQNLLAACERSIETAEQARRTLKILRGLRAAFWLIGRTSEHRRVMQQSILKWDPVFYPMDATIPEAIFEYRLNLLIDREKLAEAVASATEFRCLQEATGDLELLSRGLDYEGDVRHAFGDFEGALRCHLRCVELDKQTGNHHRALWMEAKLSGTEGASGKISEATERRKRAFQQATLLGEHNSIGIYAKEFAKTAMKEGKWAEACALAERAVEAFTLAGETTTRFAALLVLAAALLGNGRNEKAAELLDEAERDAPLADEHWLRDLAFLRKAVLDAPGRASVEDLLKIDKFY